MRDAVGKALQTTSFYTSRKRLDPLAREIKVPTAYESMRDDAPPISAETVLQKLNEHQVTYENKFAMVRIHAFVGPGIFKPSAS